MARLEPEEGDDVGRFLLHVSGVFIGVGGVILILAENGLGLWLLMVGGLSIISALKE